MVAAPETPTEPLKLRGFNFWLDLDQQVAQVDRAVKRMLPGTNMARLVLVHWTDTNNSTDCYSSNPNSEVPFLKDDCLPLFDSAVKWTTEAGIWPVLMGRAKGDPKGHVYENATLVDEMVAMWGGIAARYANVSGIAGYEVLAEPRTDNATDIHKFQVKACNAIWKHDPRAACFIGAGPFYLRYNLDERYIIEGNVIYAANYLTPKKYTTGKTAGVVYPGSKVKCGDLLETKEVPFACPGGDGNAEITFDKDLLIKLAEPISKFSQKYNVPVWVDQWGLMPNAAGASAYITDALDIFETGGHMWTQWIWRDPFGASCDKLSIVCQPTACAPFTPHASAIGPLIKYLGGDIANATAPIPAPNGTMLCRCITSAKKICAGHLDTGADCKSCLWKHASEITAAGCDWVDTHTQVLRSICPVAPPPPPPPPAPCTDISPPCKNKPGCTCTDQKQWGHCGKRFLEGYCCRTCWNCTTGCGKSGEDASFP